MVNSSQQPVLYSGPQDLAVTVIEVKTAALPASSTVLRFEADSNFNYLLENFTSLLPPSVIVAYNLEKLDQKQAQSLVQAAQNFQGLFIGHATRVTNKTKKLYEPLTFTPLSSDRKFWTRLAKTLQVELHPETLQALTNSKNPIRAANTLKVLAAAGFTNPAPAQVAFLLGSQEEAGLPWTLYTQMQKPSSKIQTTLQTSLPIPTLAFLNKRFLMALLYSEQKESGTTQETEFENLSDAFNGTTPALIRDAKTLASSLSSESLQNMVNVLARADLMSKRQNSASSALLLVASYFFLELAKNQ